MRGIAARLLPALMLASLPAHVAAQTEGAGAGACLTEPEMRSLILYALPDVADQIGKACTASLPATAYLIRSRADLAARYGAAATSQAEGARQAFFKVAGLGSGKLDTIDGKALRDLIGIGIGAALQKGIKPGDCRVINDVLEPLAPLPPQNMAALISVALREAGKRSGKDDKSSNPFRVCGTEQGQ